ncbi:Protein unc-45-like protein A [Psilocybe cubensis]|uniref:Protein unc-45-like protein A n=2 Tax=Psilocybe cubensis TaxID=181762 RepID=A0ACB8HEZ0_PSICU|nr:Protein unc-45-like protein A [Psilocybe cubensis]KAH9486272.1 Protein unc-45-like protein A [Psilocybe cubensis]
MAENTDDQRLNDILRKIQAGSNYKLLPQEIACLTSAFLSSRSDASNVRPKAYVVLSALCQEARKTKEKGKEKENDVSTKTLTKIFAPTVLNYLGETDEASLMTGICFLTALFQVEPLAASSLFSEDGLVENMMDAVDLSPSALLCQDVAHLLGQACGHKSCRTIITPQIVRWLEFKSQQTSDPVLQSAASVALIKYKKGSATDNSEAGAIEVRDSQTDDLARKLVDVVVTQDATSCTDAVEGLAYVSTDPAVKESLSQNFTFLKKLFTLIPSSKNKQKLISEQNATQIFGVILIICNIISFRPRISEEQKQVEKLKRMTKAGKELSEAAETASLLDNDDHVKKRIRLLIEAGVLPVFSSAIAATDSAGVRLNVGKCLLSIVEEKENRGKVLQAGGAKVLHSIIKQVLSSNPDIARQNQPNLTPADLEAIQALAKLAITSSPVQVFGPNVGMIYDAIRPLSCLLQNSGSNLLQQFEAIMALTNLSSHSPEVASRIAAANGLLNKVELLLLEEHTLIRRASTELICNLIAGSDEAFQRYTGDSPNSVNKIHILLALSDENDLPTRMAASGALATVTMTPTACNALLALQFEKHRFLSLMTQLIDPSVLKKDGNEEDEAPLATDPGLVHRGIVCIHNVFKSINDTQTREKIQKEAADSGLLQAIGNLIKGQGVVKDQVILHQAAEALQALIGSK